MEGEGASNGLLVTSAAWSAIAHQDREPARGLDSQAATAPVLQHPSGHAVPDARTCSAELQPRPASAGMRPDERGSCGDAEDPSGVRSISEPEHERRPADEAPDDIADTQQGAGPFLTALRQYKATFSALPAEQHDGAPTCAARAPVGTAAGRSNQPQVQWPPRSAVQPDTGLPCTAASHQQPTQRSSGRAAACVRDSPAIDLDTGAAVVRAGAPAAVHEVQPRAARPSTAHVATCKPPGDAQRDVRRSLLQPSWSAGSTQWCDVHRKQWPTAVSVRCELGPTYAHQLAGAINAPATARALRRPHSAGAKVQSARRFHGSGCSWHTGAHASRASFDNSKQSFWQAAAALPSGTKGGVRVDAHVLGLTPAAVHAVADNKRRPRASVQNASNVYTWGVTL